MDVAVRVDAERAVNGGSDVIGRPRYGDWIAARLVRLPDELPAPHAGAGKDGRVSVSPVVPARHGLPGQRRDARSPSKLADDDDQRRVQQTSLDQIVQQRAHSAIGLRQQLTLQSREVIHVSVPGLNDAHVALHDRDFRLHHAPCEKQRLAASAATVTLANFRSLGLDLKRFAKSTGSQHRVRHIELVRQFPSGSRLTKIRFGSNGLFEQFSPPLNPLHIEAVDKAQSVDFEIRFVRIVLQHERVVLRADEAGVLTRPDERSFNQRVGQRDVTRQTICRRPQIIHCGSVARPVAAVERFVLVRVSTELLDGTGQCVVRTRQMAVVAMGHRANDRQQICPIGQTGHQLAELHSGNPRIDRAELAFRFGRFRFWIEHVNVTAAAGQKDEHDRFGSLRSRGPVRRRSFTAFQQASQAKAEKRRTANLQHLTPMEHGIIPLRQSSVGSSSIRRTSLVPESHANSTLNPPQRISETANSIHAQVCGAAQAARIDRVFRCKTGRLVPSSPDRCKIDCRRIPPESACVSSPPCFCDPQSLPVFRNRHTRQNWLTW